MDMRKLLESMYKFAGEPGQKAGDQVRGTEKAKKSTKDQHPFRGRLVGGESKESQGNMLGELDQYAKDTVVERSLAERWAQFKEEVFKDTADRRPARKGSREEKVGKRGHKEQPRYNYDKEETEESRGHKAVARKLKDIESRKTMPATNDQDKAEQAKADYRKYVAKMKKENPNFVPLFKMDEAGATANPSATSTTGTLSQDAKQAIAASTQLKAATGTTAPTNQFMKAIDAATQGTAIDAKSAQALEPMMNVVKMAASDPKLAAQFKGIANQARTLTQQQKAQQK